MVNRQQLAAAAKLTNTEIPGLAYANDASEVASEIPIVDHYLQQQNCSFIQVRNCHRPHDRFGSSGNATVI